MDAKTILKMTVKTLKNHFIDALKDLYPQTEIESFFLRLLEFRLHLKRIDLALNANRNILDKEVAFFKEALLRLKNQEPLQYIIGSTEFFGLPFKVDKSVLIPRPETEELVSWILDAIKNNVLLSEVEGETEASLKNPKLKPLKILDIGTGSGCIAIALAKHLPQAEVWALDVSKKALKIAQQNADLNQVTIHFIEADILNSTTLTTKFDCIVSNPPYVKQNEISLMKPNVLNHEPHLALFVSDHNPLLFYDKIADFSKTNLNTNGTLFFEINQYLGMELNALLKRKGFANIELRQDLFKVDRMVKATINQF